MAQFQITGMIDTSVNSPDISDAVFGILYYFPQRTGLSQEIQILVLTLPVTSCVLLLSTLTSQDCTFLSLKLECK